MKSLYCLYTKFQPVIFVENRENMDPVQQHTVTKILTHLQVMEGIEWNNLQKELGDEGIELTSFDTIELESKIEEYNKIKSQLSTAEQSLKIIADQKLEENMKDLMNKLNLYKSQQSSQNIRQSNKEALLGSTIKLNKDQKDEIVAKSLQLDETMRRVFGDK